MLTEREPLVKKPCYAVVVTFSFDPTPTVFIFDTWDDAVEFIKRDVENEYRIDTQENGMDSEYHMYEDGGRAVLKTHYNTIGDPVVTEWSIGNVYVERPGQW